MNDLVDRELAESNIGLLMDELHQARSERDAARRAIRSVFDLIERGDLEVSHLGPMGHGEQCPEDDTCQCPVRRHLLELQLAGDINPDGARALLAKLPSAGPHDRADCPCGHPLGTIGVCGGCNCADEAPCDS